MVTENHRKSAILLMLTLLWVSSAYGHDTQIETPNTSNTLERQALSEDSSPKEPKSEPQISGGLFPMGQIHRIIREERIKTLKEIDKERKETLAYLTQERQAAVDELEKELKRITDLLQS
jgi:hypothetical protein